MRGPTLRYTHGHSRWIQKFPIQDEAHRLDVYTDNDLAHDQDRMSVSCVVTMMGTHCLRAQVATQTAPALSTGGAKLVAQVTGASMRMCVQSMARDTVRKVSVRLHTDSTASNCKQSGTRQSPTSGHWVAVDTTPRDSPKPSHPQGGGFRQ